MFVQRIAAPSVCFFVSAVLAGCSGAEPPPPEPPPEPAPRPQPAAAAVPATAPPAVDGLDEPLPPFDEIMAELVVREGRLSGASGEVRLYQIPDGEALLRFEGFRLPSAAGVDVRLGPATDRGAKASLGALKARSGNFNYLLEPGQAPGGEVRVELYDAGKRAVIASADLH